MLAALEVRADVGDHRRGVVARFPSVDFSPVDFRCADQGEQGFHFRDSVFCASIGVEYRESLKKVLRSRHSAKLNLENVIIREVVLFPVIVSEVRAVTVVAHHFLLIVTKQVH